MCSKGASGSRNGRIWLPQLSALLRSPHVATCVHDFRYIARLSDGWDGPLIPLNPQRSVVMGQKLSKLSCCRRRHRGAAGRSSAVDLPPTPAQKSEDASSFVGATLSGREISPSILPAPHSNHQPTGSRPLSAEKERSESALAPTAALSLSSLGSGGGGRCAGRWYI